MKRVESGRERDERLWIEKAKRLFKSMPPGLEFVGYECHAAICEAGALRTFLDTSAGFGTAEYIEIISHKRIHTHGECI